MNRALTSNDKERETYHQKIHRLKKTQNSATSTTLEINGEPLYLTYSVTLSSKKKCDILHVPETDHSTVSIQLQSKELGLKRGLGMWKLNAALLEDVTYVTALKMVIPIELSGKAEQLGYT